MASLEIVSHGRNSTTPDAYTSATDNRATPNLDLLKIKNPPEIKISPAKRRRDSHRGTSNLFTHGDQWINATSNLKGKLPER